jgi:hypothetical protein
MFNIIKFEFCIQFFSANNLNAQIFFKLPTVSLTFGKTGHRVTADRFTVCNVPGFHLLIWGILNIPVTDGFAE